MPPMKNLRLSFVFVSAIASLYSVYAEEDEPREEEGTVTVQHSNTCAMCHSNCDGSDGNADESERGIAPFDLWQGSMMANSARDPLWRAAVSAEIQATPSRREDIEKKCLSCHSPMAHNLGYDDHDTGSMMHILDCGAEIGQLARDGVSCTICHGITPDGLGTEASFAAGYQLDSERRLFGPHASPFTMPMRHHTAFTRPMAHKFSTLPCAEVVTHSRPKRSTPRATKSVSACSNRRPISNGSIRTIEPKATRPALLRLVVRAATHRQRTRTDA